MRLKSDICYWILRSFQLFVVGVLPFSLYSEALVAQRCPEVFRPSNKILEFGLGVRQTQSETAPLGLQVITSRYKLLENAVNVMATHLLGPSLKLDQINKVARTFLSDTSIDPYYVRLARAFDYQIQIQDQNVMKSIPESGPTLLVVNHPRNGSDGIAVAAVASRIRSDVKVVMTVFLDQVPGMKENAIFLNPYPSKEAQEFNKIGMEQMVTHLKQGGLLIMFASGEVSLKKPNSPLLPVDSKWKNGAGGLLKEVSQTQVIPVFVGGEASPKFYQAREKGQGLHTASLHVGELTYNRGTKFPITFANPILGSELLVHYEYRLKDIMKYLRARSYLMSEQTLLDQKTKVSRPLQVLAKPQDPIRVFNDIQTYGKLLIADPKKSVEVHLVEGAKLTEPVWQELGLVRERSFRSVGEGSGRSLDIDTFDRYYHHVIAIDTGTNKILGAYRIGRVDQILSSIGYEGLYTSQFFSHRDLVDRYGNQMLELGRSFVDFETGPKAIIALDRLWKGITSFIAENPHYRYLVGPVSISDNYTQTSKLLMLKYLERNIDFEKAIMVQGRTALDMDHQFKDEIALIAQKTADLKELNRLVTQIEDKAIPPLLMSYDKLGAKYLAFTRDLDFNTIDGLIIVDLRDASAHAEASKHFGERWTDYLKFDQK